MSAAGSAAPNIAEGFRRYTHPEFIRFLRYAFASIGETQTRLEEGCHRGYFTARELTEIFTLARRAGAATTSLIKSLGGGRR